MYRCPTCGKEDLPDTTSPCWCFVPHTPREKVVERPQPRVPDAWEEDTQPMWPPGHKFAEYWRITRLV